MVVQIFGTPKCKVTRKAERFFKERRVSLQIIDLREKGLSPGEFRNIIRVVSPEGLIDTESRQYRDRNLAYMKFDLEEELLNDPLLLRTPIVRYGSKVTIGYEPEIWKEWLAQDKSA